MFDGMKDETGGGWGSSLLSTLSLDNLSLSITHGPFVNSAERNWSYGERAIDDYDLFVAYEGEARFEIEDESYLLEAGHAILIPPRRRFSIRTFGPPYPASIAQHFTLTAFSGVDIFSLIDYRIQALLSRKVEILPLFTRYAALYDSPSFALTGKSLFLYVLFAFLEDAYLKDRLESYSNHLILRFLKFLEIHAFEPDVIEMFMEQSPYCSDYTVQLFKSFMGRTPKAYVLDKRMTRAKNLLLRGFSVKETARECLYDDEFYFSRSFKKHAGVSPTEFRKRLLADT